MEYNIISEVLKELRSQREDAKEHARQFQEYVRHSDLQKKDIQNCIEKAHAQGLENTENIKAIKETIEKQAEDIKAFRQFKSTGKKVGGAVITAFGTSLIALLYSWWTSITDILKAFFLTK